MFRCNLCNQRFPDETLLQSIKDEYFCTDCFKSRYVSDRREQERKSKRQPIAINKCEGDSRHSSKPKSFFTPSEISVICETSEAKANVCRAPSKRPLQCPHQDCNKYISVLDLNAHFQHDHKEVPILQSPFGSRNPVIACTADIRYGVRQTLALINIQIPSADAGRKSPPEYNRMLPSHYKKQKPASQQLTLAVVASRISPSQLQDPSYVVDSKSSPPSSCSDRLIFWTGSNIVTDYSYSLVVSSSNNDLRFKYCGPIWQLGSPSSQVYSDGHCLVLGYWHFTKMSENGTKPLGLDVVVHSPD